MAMADLAPGLLHTVYSTHQEADEIPLTRSQALCSSVIHGTPMEVRVVRGEPPTPPQRGLGGELERPGTLRDLSLPRGLGDATLGDPAIDHVLWCARFRKWRTIQGISARYAVAVLKWNYPERVAFDFFNIAAYWKKSGKNEPRTEQDWEEYLAFALELISTHAGSGIKPTLEMLTNEWEGLAQGDQDAVQFATSVLKVADQFKRLKKPVIKSTNDILDKMIAGANRDLFIYLKIAMLLVDPADEPSPDDEQLAFREILSKAKAFDAIVLTANERPPPRLPQKNSRAAGHPARENRDSRSVPIKNTLCRAHASGRSCSHGRTCRRLHMPAAHYMRLPYFSLQSKKEQLLIKDIVRSGASPGHPAQSHHPGRTGTRSLAMARHPASQRAIEVNWDGELNRALATLDLDGATTPSVSSICGVQNSH